MNKDLNQILGRQLRKLGLDAHRPPDAETWSKLLHVINRTYQDADQDRYTLERALAISSEEMHSLYQQQKSSFEVRLRTLFGTIQDLVWIKDPYGVYLACNPMFERFLGAGEAEIVGKTDSDFVDKDLADLFRQSDRLAISKGGPSSTEEWVRFADDGHKVLLETIRTPMHDESGRLIGVIGIARDITERKLLEQHLRIAATAFESQEGMTITDASKVILRVNQAFSRITGYSAEEIVGKTPSFLSSGRHNAAFYAAMWKGIESTGSWQGEIWNRRKNGDVYPEWLTISAVLDGHGQVTNYVGAFSDITQRKRTEEQIHRLAFSDPLTSLPNRRLLLDRLQHALAASSRNKRHGALFFIDLDDFKDLNDTLGHDKGDLLLQQVAARLVGCLREGDTVARLGGDEFVVMLENLDEKLLESSSQADKVGEKIFAALNQPYLLGETMQRSSPSIGVTLFGDQHNSVEELLKQADLAMYQAKKSGRNALRFFDPKMQTDVAARVAMEADLRQGIANHQFILHYQPQMDHTGRTTGAEALVRWQHPQRGIVYPAEFIPLAENTGLILPLGLFVLESACAQLNAWAKQPETAHLTLAVNVSAQQLRQKDFVGQVLAAVDCNNTDPGKLKLELTESMLLDDIEDIIFKMTALKKEKVHFSLDDFGTGYSSLSYLKRLPLDQLKIDQSFVRDVLFDPNDAAIARTIVALAHILGLTVIAEGVETNEQLLYLGSIGCHAYQGYLFSRPVPLEAFEAFARQF